MLLILNNAAQGILSSFFFKYAALSGDQDGGLLTSFAILCLNLSSSKNSTQSYSTAHGLLLTSVSQLASFSFSNTYCRSTKLEAIRAFNPTFYGQGFYQPQKFKGERLKKGMALELEICQGENKLGVKMKQDLVMVRFTHRAHLLGLNGDSKDSIPMKMHQLQSLMSQSISLAKQCFRHSVIQKGRKTSSAKSGQLLFKRDLDLTVVANGYLSQLRNKALTTDRRRSSLLMH